MSRQELEAKGYVFAQVDALKYKFAWWHPHCDKGCSTCVHWTEDETQAIVEARKHHGT